MRNLILGIILILIVIILKPSLFLPTTSQPPTIIQPSPTLSAQEAVVTKVFDGDTIEINGKEKLRYIGIDTPEITSNDCFSHEATQRNRELVMGKTITIEKDVSDVDKYNRKLRYVYLSDGTFVNKQLVEEGYAKTLPIKPDIHYASLFHTIELQAKKENKGLWARCKK